MVANRILALDAMRCYTIAAMILVSTPATWECKLPLIRTVQISTIIKFD